MAPTNHKWGMSQPSQACVEGWSGNTNGPCFTIPEVHAGLPPPVGRSFLQTGWDELPSRAPPARERGPLYVVSWAFQFSWSSAGGSGHLAGSETVRVGHPIIRHVLDGPMCKGVHSVQPMVVIPPGACQGAWRQGWVWMVSCEIARFAVGLDQATTHRRARSATRRPDPSQRPAWPCAEPPPPLGSSRTSCYLGGLPPRCPARRARPASPKARRTRPSKAKISSPHVAATNGAPGEAFGQMDKSSASIFGAWA